MRSRGLYILALDAPAQHAGDMRASYEAVYALAKEIGDERAMCQALIPTMVFLDYWQEYHEEALRDGDEATALAAELGDEELPDRGGVGAPPAPGAAGRAGADVAHTAGSSNRAAIRCA